MSSGELKLASAADLGALGARQGPAVSYQWLWPSRLAQLLVPMGLLLLLFPRRNHSTQALWIAAAVALSLGFESLLWAIPQIGSEAPAGLFEALGAAVVGLGAVWLLLPYLKTRGRFLTFLAMLATMEFAGVLAFLIARQWSTDAVPTEMLLPVTFLGLLLTLAINLAGWSCRGSFDRRRLSAWSLVWIVAGCTAFFLVMSAAAGHGPWLEMLLALAVFSAVSFGLLLPFLVLSFANPFYRGRLKELLCLAEPTPAAPPEHS